jgi:hypothetical protein
MFLSGMDMKPFVPVTAEQLIFGYDDPLVSIAHQSFPKALRPMSQMGLLLGVSLKLFSYGYSIEVYRLLTTADYP